MYHMQLWRSYYPYSLDSLRSNIKYCRISYFTIQNEREEKYLVVSNRQPMKNPFLKNTGLYHCSGIGCYQMIAETTDFIFHIRRFDHIICDESG